MLFQTIELKMEEGIATITLNRPQALNALNRQLLGELEEAVEQVGADEAVRVVIITGSGERAFSAGADISEFKEMSAIDALNFARFIQRVFLKVESLPKPAIAAVNGYALGGGCELMMACDIAYASERARVGQPEINLGVIPGGGGTQRLPRLIGKQRAKELILTGDMIDANEALRLGLVSKIFPPDQLMPAVNALAEKLKSKGTVALRVAKEAIEEGFNTDLLTGMSIEAKAWSVCFSTEDKSEGIAAFLEKRSALFKGR
ncbi:MAG: enoyl-CoA hydratase/isomerase family protein [Candidatus Tectomicrobia bacterium]|nr:enoyl-CoA hydratase/isomerase family protein [Candidatus Tectomicrobia bacterium]